MYNMHDEMEGGEVEKGYMYSHSGPKCKRPELSFRLDFLNFEPDP